MTAMLPAGFEDLEPYAARWSLATEGERYAARLSSSMDDMEAFYTAAMARTDGIQPSSPSTWSDRGEATPGYSRDGRRLT